MAFYLGEHKRTKSGTDCDLCLCFSCRCFRLKFCSCSVSVSSLGRATHLVIEKQRGSPAAAGLSALLHKLKDTSVSGGWVTPRGAAEDWERCRIGSVFTSKNAAQKPPETNISISIPPIYKRTRYKMQRCIHAAIQTDDNCLAHTS